MYGIKCIQHDTIFYYTAGPVYKDHPWEHNTMVFIHRWSLIQDSFMQKMSNWDTQSVVAIDRKSLFHCTSLTVLQYYFVRRRI